MTRGKNNSEGKFWTNEEKKSKGYEDFAELALEEKMAFIIHELGTEMIKTLNYLLKTWPLLAIGDADHVWETSIHNIWLPGDLKSMD